MHNTAYKIYFSGHFSPNTDPETVLLRLNKIISFDMENKALFMNGTPILLKTGLTHDAALSLENALNNCGLEVYIEADQENKVITNNEIIQAPPLFAVNFEGRLNRLTYLNYSLYIYTAISIIYCTLGFIDILVDVEESDTIELLYAILGVLMIIEIFLMLRLTILRLNDIGTKNGFLYVITGLFHLTYILSPLVFIVFSLVKGKTEANEFGNPTKGARFGGIVFFFGGLLTLFIFSVIFAVLYYDYI